ncbi:MAG: transporter substrate-binding domain-containing protein [Ruminococcaceae bacterium]|nr:transporter substrate-binding domain-containing protein [Oscillospiraceae bacterium]
MKKILAFCLSLIMVLSFTGCNKRGTDLEEVVKNGKLVVGVCDNQPMTYKENGQWTGFDIELAKLFAKKLGVKAEFVEVKAAEKYQNLIDYNIDCIWSGLTLGLYGQEDLSMSDPYVDNSQVIVMKKNVIGNYQNGYEVRQLKFSAQTDSSGYYAIDREKYKKLILVETKAQALELVENGTVDATIVDGNVADALIGESKKFPSLAKGFSYSVESYGVAFRNSSDLTKLFNEFLKDEKDNALWKLAEKYDLTLS